MNPVVSYIKQTLQGYYPDSELVPMAKLLLTQVFGMSVVELYAGKDTTFSVNERKQLDDILVRLIVKKHPQESVYLSHRNSKTDFPVLTCAISLGKEEAYAVVGARPSRAVKVKLSDQWNVMIKDDEGRRKIADEVTGQLNFGSNMRGSADYRRHLSEVLIRRGLAQLEERREN